MVFKPGGKPWNKGKKGVQIGWNKGLTKETNESLARVSKHTSETRKRLFKEGKLICALKGTRLSEERKRRQSALMVIKHKKWSETDPDYKLRQSNAGKKTTGGKVTAQRHPELYKEFGRKLKEYMKNNPIKTKEYQRKGGKKSIIKLTK